MAQPNTFCYRAQPTNPSPQFYPQPNHAQPTLFYSLSGRQINPADASPGFWVYKGIMHNGVYYPTPQPQYHFVLPLQSYSQTGCQQNPVDPPAGFWYHKGIMHDGVYYPAPQPHQHTQTLVKEKGTGQKVQMCDPKADGRKITMSELLGEKATPSTHTAPTSGEIMDAEQAVPSTPLTPTAPTSVEIMDAKPSTPLASTVPTAGEIMDAEDAKPSIPLTPKALTWADIVGANLEKVVEQKKTVKEIREQRKQTVEVEKQKNKAEVKPQLPRNNKKLPMDKSPHRKNTKRVELFVRNLDYSVDNKRLYDEFLAFGNVIDAKVIMKDGHSKGFGFISFPSMKEAMMAVEEMNGNKLGRRTLYVTLAKSREERQLDPAPTEQRKGSGQPTMPQRSPLNERERVQPQREEPLPQRPRRTKRRERDRSTRKPPADPNATNSTVTPHTTEAKVEEQIVYPTRDPNSNQKIQERELMHAEDAKPSTSNTNNLQMDEPRHGKNTKRVELVIKNLDDSVDDKCLYDEFIPFGNVVDAKVMIEDGRSKGFGFVSFSSMMEAMMAVEEMNGAELGSRTLYVTLSER